MLIPIRIVGSGSQCSNEMSRRTDLAVQEQQGSRPEWKQIRNALLTVMRAVGLCLLAVGPGAGQVRADSQAVVERIEFVGNRRMRTDTLRARTFTRAGDTFSEESLKRDFLALWNTQFFEDIKLRVENVPGGRNAKIVIFEVQERPVIRRIRYEGIHSVTESDILERFKDRKVGLTVESQFDPAKIKKAQVVLGELLGEHGRQFATVVPQYERIASSNAVILIFKVSEGMKVKVGKIRFTGNHTFSDRKLIRAMRHGRPYAIPLYFSTFDVMAKTYDRDKLSEDLEVGLRGLYQNNGFFRALVKEPILKNIDSTRNRLGVPLTGKSRGKAVDITIPIEEGLRYRMGTLRIVSADPDKSLSLKVEALRAAFPLKPGEYLDVSKIRKALKDYTTAYGQYGFIDFTAEPDFDIDEATTSVGITLRFDEQKQYYVRRIDFSGNHTTRDKVIRRELLLDEGQLFNKRSWELSILRLNQLDYFERIDPEKSVEIKRNAKDSAVDLELKIKEKGKQSIGLQGGVSGLSGGFIGLTYQTNNFLGLGETLTLSAQVGARQRSFLFGFTEPYLLDRPISTGFTIFDSQYRYNQQQELSILSGQQLSLNPASAQNYTQNSKGFTVFASFLPRHHSFTRFGITYSYTKTDINATTNAAQVLFNTLQFRSFSGPSALQGIVSSRITPTITYNTVDNPSDPSRGKSYFFSVGVEGIGGNARSITPMFEAKYFRPVHHRNVLGFRLQAAYTTGYGGIEPAPNNRFYTGGDDSVRGFDIRSISPVAFVPVVSNTSIAYYDPNQLGGGGQPINRVIGVPVLTYTIVYPGGDTQLLGNAEYRIPLVGPVAMALFFDAGVNGILRRSQLQLDPAGFNQLQTTFPNATVSNSLQLAPGSNFLPRTSTGVEFVVRLPIVQAPFRVYWAFNPSLYSHVVTAPASSFYLSDSFRSSLPPGVYDLQVAPALNQLLSNPQQIYFNERRSTFRFSVSRTF